MMKRVKAIVLVVMAVCISSAVLSAFVGKKEYSANVVVTRSKALEFKLYDIGTASEARFNFPSVTP